MIDVIAAAMTVVSSVFMHSALVVKLMQLAVACTFYEVAYSFSTQLQTLQQLLVAARGSI